MQEICGNRCAYYVDKAIKMQEICGKYTETIMTDPLIMLDNRLLKHETRYEKYIVWRTV